MGWDGSGTGSYWERIAKLSVDGKVLMDFIWLDFDILEW